MRRRFSREFSFHAVELVMQCHVWVAQARRDLDVAERVLTHNILVRKDFACEVGHLLPTGSNHDLRCRFFPLPFTTSVLDIPGNVASAAAGLTRSLPCVSHLPLRGPSICAPQ